MSIFRISDWRRHTDGLHKNYFLYRRKMSFLGPMAEWIMKSILMDKSKQFMSRGLVVLFAEPRDQRVTEQLMNHGFPARSRYRKNFMQSKLMRNNACAHDEFYRKSQSSRRLWCDGNMYYTLREFVQEEDGKEFDPDVPDPYGSGDEAYEECYLELKDLLYRVKKKITVELKYEEGVTI